MKLGPDRGSLKMIPRGRGKLLIKSDQINDSLLRDFGEFDQRKSEYFQPSVESLMCAEALFFKDMTNACEKALVGMNVGGADPHSSQNVVQQKLNEIKTLSIVVHR